MYLILINTRAREWQRLWELTEGKNTWWFKEHLSADKLSLGKNQNILNMSEPQKCHIIGIKNLKISFERFLEFTSYYLRGVLSPLAPVLILTRSEESRRPPGHQPLLAYQTPRLFCQTWYMPPESIYKFQSVGVCYHSSDKCYMCGKWGIWQSFRDLTFWLRLR